MNVFTVFSNDGCFAGLVHLVGAVGVSVMLLQTECEVYVVFERVLAVYFQHKRHRNRKRPELIFEIMKAI